MYFSKGYGFADLETQQEVDTNQTICTSSTCMLVDISAVGVGSLSNTFTATAVMQLHEHGKLDFFSKEINYYLKKGPHEPLFVLPVSRYSEPITLANLLTHTGGVDERYSSDTFISNFFPGGLPLLLLMKMKSSLLSRYLLRQCG